MKCEQERKIHTLFIKQMRAGCEHARLLAQVCQGGEGLTSPPLFLNVAMIIRAGCNCHGMSNDLSETYRTASRRAFTRFPAVGRRALSHGSVHRINAFMPVAGKCIKAFLPVTWQYMVSWIYSFVNIIFILLQVIWTNIKRVIILISDRYSGIDFIDTDS